MLRSDVGAGGVMALAIAAVTVVVSLAFVGLGSALVVRQRVVAAADAAALGAADTLLGWVAAEPCAVAGELAHAHNVELVGCEIDGAEVLVMVRADSWGVAIESRSRAGPPR